MPALKVAKQAALLQHAFAHNYSVNSCNNFALPSKCLATICDLRMLIIIIIIIIKIAVTIFFRTLSRIYRDLFLEKDSEESQSLAFKVETTNFNHSKVMIIYHSDSIIDTETSIYFFKSKSKS